jgi:aspartyl-tRNA(Asn)/glutamyl-tRNA(Gln) amidotransferase subunit C
MNIKDVENLAELARIELSEDEKKELLSDMDSILGYVKQIEEIKIEDTVPEYNIYNVWREDKIIPRDFSLELIKEQFPDSKTGFLKVKKIL